MTRLLNEKKSESSPLPFFLVRLKQNRNWKNSNHFSWKRKERRRKKIGENFESCERTRRRNHQISKWAKFALFLKSHDDSTLRMNLSSIQKHSDATEVKLLSQVSCCIRWQEPLLGILVPLQLSESISPAFIIFIQFSAPSSRLCVTSKNPSPGKKKWREKYFPRDLGTDPELTMHFKASLFFLP